MRPHSFLFQDKVAAISAALASASGLAQNRSSLPIHSPVAWAPACATNGSHLLSPLERHQRRGRLGGMTCRQHARWRSSPSPGDNLHHGMLHGWVSPAERVGSPAPNRRFAGGSRRRHVLFASSMPHLCPICLRIAAEGDRCPRTYFLSTSKD